MNVTVLKNISSIPGLLCKMSAFVYGLWEITIKNTDRHIFYCKILSFLAPWLQRWTSVNMMGKGLKWSKDRE